MNGLWGVSPRHVDLSFPSAFNKAIASWSASPGGPHYDAVHMSRSYTSTEAGESNMCEHTQTINICRLKKYMHTCIQSAYMHAYIHTDTHTDIHTDIHSYINAYIP